MTRLTFCLLILALMGCTSTTPFPNEVRVSPATAAPSGGPLTVQFVDRPPADGFYRVTANDGREWDIPTAFYQPNKVGVDGLLMKDYVRIYQRFSPTREIIGLQENGDGENISRRLLFIHGRTARLFDIVSANRSRSGLPEAEPVFWYTWVINEVRDDGVVISGILFPWRHLRLVRVGTYEA